VKIYPIKTLIIAATAGSLHFTIIPTAGTVFDPAAEFSLSSNPAGVWSYGYSLAVGGPLILFTEKLNMGAVDIWRTNILYDVPSISQNPTTEMDPIIRTSG
jgi:hypothetical protein